MEFIEERLREIRNHRERIRGIDKDLEKLEELIIKQQESKSDEEIIINNGEEEQMANISEFVKHKGMFLKAEDVKKSKEPTFVITAEAITVTNKFGNNRVHIPGELEGKEYLFDCSITNARIISEVLGEETKEWIGSSLRLETYKTKTTEGILTDAINIAAVISKEQKI